MDPRSTPYRPPSDFLKPKEPDFSSGSGSRGNAADENSIPELDPYLVIPPQITFATQEDILNLQSSQDELKEILYKVLDAVTKISHQDKITTLERYIEDLQKQNEQMEITLQRCVLMCMRNSRQPDHVNPGDKGSEKEHDGETPEEEGGNGQWDLGDIGLDFELGGN